MVTISGNTDLADLRKKTLSENPIMKSNFRYLSYNEFSLFNSSSLKCKYFWEISTDAEAGPMLHLRLAATLRNTFGG